MQSMFELDESRKLVVQYEDFFQSPKLVFDEMSKNWAWLIQTKPIGERKRSG
jgi:hypothetical protein